MTNCERFRLQLKGPGKKLDTYVTFYTQFLHKPWGDYLKLIDVIILWTGHVQDLAHLDENLALLDNARSEIPKDAGIIRDGL